MLNIPDNIIKAAQAAEKKWKICASIQIAQWALESGWGAHIPPGSNNPFGVKKQDGHPFVTVPTHEFIHGERILVNAAFRVYASIDDAFDYHACLLATGKPYQHIYNLGLKWMDYAKAMGPIYATDPNYGQLIIEIIQEHNLGQYDVTI